VTRDPSAPAAAPARRGRLTRAAEFDAVSQLGRSVAGRYLTLRYRAAEGGGVPRIGYAIPRKVGGAVDRNAVKRRLREAVDRNEGLLQPATDYVFIARPGVAEVLETQGFAWLSEQVGELLTRAQEQGSR
jgi:ribonuclease P protein component